MENFWSHGLGCRPMKDFMFHGLGCRPMEEILFHGLGCCPMKDFFCSMDLVVVLWKISFCSMDLVVVLWKILNLIKSWESSHRLNLIMSLLVAISLLIRLIGFCFFLFAGVDDVVHVSEEIDEVGITGEVTAVSPPRRPTIEVGSSIGVGSLSGEVAAFLREFDVRAPNPYPEQFFWSFNGPLVPFGIFGFPMIVRLICRGCLRDIVILPKASSLALGSVDP